MMAPAPQRDDLPAAQAMMLDVMRMWVMAMRRGVNLEARIDERLDLMGAGGASPHLKRFMFALSGGCTRMIEVQCTCKSDIGADEEALLDVLSLAQALNTVAALAVLRRFVTEDGAQCALEAAEGLGEALSQAGCFLEASDPSGEDDLMDAALADRRVHQPTLH